MRIGRDFVPARGIIARLVVQGAIGPLDRLSEPSREEMSERRDDSKVEAERIERAQAQRPIARFDRLLGLVTLRVECRSRRPGGGRIGIKRQPAIKRRRRHRRFAGKVEEREPGPCHRLGIVAFGFKCLSRQTSGCGYVGIR